MLHVTATPVTSENATVTDRRAGRSPRDMALSLLVLLVPIFLIMAIYRGLHGGDQPVTVDAAPETARAAQAGLTVTPRDLPDGWRVVTAAYNGRTGTLRLGYLTGAEKGLQLVEAKRPDLAQEELTSTGRQTGTVTIGGAEWQRWTGRTDENALVLVRDGITIVVSGRVDQADLTRLAERL